MTDEERARALAELLKSDVHVLVNPTHEELIEFLNALFPPKEQEEEE